MSFRRRLGQATSTGRKETLKNYYEDEHPNRNDPGYNAEFQELQDERSYYINNNLPIPDDLKERIEANLIKGIQEIKGGKRGGKKKSKKTRKNRKSKKNHKK
jgi:hypothetical protein